MIQLIHLRRKCIGCNACVEIAPNRWVMSEKDGKSYLRKSKQRGEFHVVNVGHEELEDNLAAAKNCPVKIIWVKEL